MLLLLSRNSMVDAVARVDDVAREMLLVIESLNAKLVW
jgi:hypothetical protein